MVADREVLRVSQHQPELEYSEGTTTIIEHGIRRGRSSSESRSIDHTARARYTRTQQ